jgi:hypothetical protein
MPTSAAAAVLFGCSVWYDDLPVGQCATDSDCEAIGSGICDPSERVCVSPSVELSLSVGEPGDCHGVPGIWAADPAGGRWPLSKDCTCLAGAWDNPDALVVGVIAPQTFGSLEGDSLQIPYVSRWQKSLGLALEEWSRELPDGVLPRSRRPLALLHCDSHDELFRARRAMTHLIGLGNVPIVITLTDNDTRAIRQQSLQENLPVICATCFSSPLDDPSAASAVWPIAPALIQQAALAAARVVELAPVAADATAPASVVILSQHYPGIDEFATEVERLVQSRGHHLVHVQSPDPHEQSVSQLEVAQSVVDAEPRVIVVGMDTDFTTYYLSLIESRWPEGRERPAYVLSYMNQELGLLADVVGSDEDLRRRISGVGWWPTPDERLNLAALEERFMLRHGEPLEQTQFGYDAFYAAGYALAWTDPRLPLDGAGVARGLEHLRAGARVDVAPASIRRALVQLGSGEDIDIVGSSNGLDWHASTHATASDVTLWCLARNPDGSLALQASAGPIWRAATGEITGSYSCP